MTDIEYKVTKTIDPEWNAYDTAVAKSHLHNWGIIFIDDYGCPIDNEHDLIEIADDYKIKKSSKKKLSEDLKDDDFGDGFAVWIGNLGKYNEGKLVGKWLALPTTKEHFQEALADIGISDKPDADGNYYEEIEIMDYNWPFDFENPFGEYASINDVNNFALVMEDMSDDEIELAGALHEATDDDIITCLANAKNGNCRFYYDVNTDEDIGYWAVDYMYGGVESLTKDTLESYFDYRQLGRELNDESYEMNTTPEEQQAYEEWEDGDTSEEPELDSGEYIDADTKSVGAGMYWCDDEGASEDDIGHAYVDAVGMENVQNPEYYFDYDMFGRDLRFDGQIALTSNGMVDYSDFNSGLGIEDCDIDDEDLYSKD